MSEHCPLDTDGDGNCPVHSNCATGELRHVPYWMQNARRKEEPDYLKGPDPHPEKKSMRFYISFGQAHAHRIDGFTYDCNSLMLVEAPGEMAARVGVNKLTEGKWSSIYQEKDLAEMLPYYPRGVINAEKPVEIYVE